MPCIYALCPLASAQSASAAQLSIVCKRHVSSVKHLLSAENAVQADRERCFRERPAVVYNTAAVTFFQNATVVRCNPGTSRV